MERLLNLLDYKTQADLIERASTRGIGDLAHALHAVFDEHPGYAAELQHLCLPHDALACSEKEAERFKGEGAKLFTRADYDGALHKYSESLRHSGLPSRAGSCARLLHNRALCILKAMDGRPADAVELFLANRRPLKPIAPPDADARTVLLHAALMNCDEAIRLDRAYDKAFFRRAEVLARLGRPLEALESAQVAAQLNASPEVAALVERLQKAIDGPPTVAAAAAAPAADGPADREEPPGAIAEADLFGLAPRQRLAQSLSKGSLQAVFAEGRGRELQAAKDLPEGKVLYCERPWAHSLTKDGRGQHCDRCLCPLSSLSLLPCEHCSVHAFCSPACRREAHAERAPYGGECGLVWPLALPCFAVLAARSALRSMLDAAAIEGGGTWEEQDRSEVIDTLEAPFAEALSAPDDLLRTAVLARVLSSCIEASLLATARVSEEVLGPALTERVLRSLLAVRGNGVAVVPREKRSDSDRIALGLYPLTSGINHGCRPNVALAFEGRAVTVRAIRPLVAGEPLAHSYGPEEGSQPTALRRAMLREQYGFVCGCAACEAGERDPKARAREAGQWGVKCAGGAAAGCGGTVAVDYEAFCRALPRPLQPEMIEPGSEAFPLLWRAPGVVHAKCACLDCGRELGESAAKKLPKELDECWADFIEAEGFAASSTGAEDRAPPAMFDLKHAVDHYQDALQGLLDRLPGNHRLIGFINNRLMKVYAFLNDKERALGYGMASIKVLQAAYHDERTSPQIAFLKLDLAQTVFDLEEQEAKRAAAGASRPAAGPRSQVALQLQAEGAAVIERLYGPGASEDGH